ncbi:uncharacterized protein LOC120353885 [Nilaparvata lugens]|uniref:uncharacterized protein LOC120353885 n=1 Tax=Nilaparvata lugens TaxID=108931 RepID=UPI00193D0D4B|nr:uncharacterized protein LOC120353885 [Nilaparvata lugens]
MVCFCFLVNPISVANMIWTGAHRGFAVRAYYENNKSVIATQRAFRRQFNIPRNNAVPNANTIRSWIRQMEETGSTLKTNTHCRRKSIRTPENVQRVRTAFEQSPERSARRHSLALGISDRSLRRILHFDLKFHPFKIMIAQELRPVDYANRQNLCEQMLAQIPPHAAFFSSDEAHFHLSGCVNKQNFRYWAEENPRIIHERPQHSPKVTVWCAISQFGVVGPYFFEEEEVTVTVNSQRYVSMLRNFLQPKLEEMVEEHGLADLWFQQDGATAHTARISLDVLREMFPGRLVSLRGDVGWPARSPDLSICDFFLGDI